MAPPAIATMSLTRRRVVIMALTVFVGIIGVVTVGIALSKQTNEKITVLI